MRRSMKHIIFMTFPQVPRYRFGGVDKFTTLTMLQCMLWKERYRMKKRSLFFWLPHGVIISSGIQDYSSVGLIVIIVSSCNVRSMLVVNSKFLLAKEGTNQFPNKPTIAIFLHQLQLLFILLLSLIDGLHINTRKITKLCYTVDNQQHNKC